MKLGRRLPNANKKGMHNAYIYTRLLNPHLLRQDQQRKLHR